MTASDRIQRSAPWWRVGMVWLVLGGPASVVVAGFVTLYIAMGVSDEVLSTAAGARKPTTAPAMQGRNHAATGGAPAAAPTTP